MLPMRVRWVSYLTGMLACFIGGVCPVHSGTFDSASGRDFRQTIQARKLLHDDPRLASLNLGVNVLEGVAILWGPAPSAQLAHQAEERLRGMIELVDVRNQLHVSDESSSPAQQPAIPQFLPEPSVPQRPTPRTPGNTRPLIQLGVELVRELEPIEPVTVNASPAARLERHLPLLGTIALPNSNSKSK